MSNAADNIQPIPGPMNKKQLAAWYRVGVKLFDGWYDALIPEEAKERIGPYTGRCYTPAQLEIIIHYLGRPE
ncbi:hypothetical protein HQ865_01235 [Mucilaginibacter mali]|uniref:DUF4248 domain-containing protein n=1 Tax=Mucilaginibacter mali TaxID=2740462 RepID=A0A7D4U8T3_9SPHI|nr:hypothetical protein [Mucilaginibacter mali]QKJ28438.1 hypothetical protein HQ865_01235 [Mucilaginibacter mali]